MNLLKLIIQVAMLLYIAFIVLCLGIAMYLNLTKKEKTDEDRDTF